MILALLAATAMQSPPLCDAANNWCAFPPKAITTPLRPCPRFDADGMPLLSNGCDPTTAVPLITVPGEPTYTVYVKHLPPDALLDGHVHFPISASVEDVCLASYPIAGDLTYRMEADEATLTCESGEVVSVVRKP